uniref:Uncharacterized protein n=1 Tax=Rhizophagus irregularis (strain DAOM 181602 / DAOM 197198 / MUCL 43194) TaxID=747089 RepID=U9SK71_RHIID
MLYAKDATKNFIWHSSTVSMSGKSETKKLAINKLMRFLILIRLFRRLFNYPLMEKNYNEFHVENNIMIKLLVSLKKVLKGSAELELLVDCVRKSDSKLAMRLQFVQHRNDFCRKPILVQAYVKVFHVNGGIEIRKKSLSTSSLCLKAFSCIII